MKPNWRYCALTGTPDEVAEALSELHRPDSGAVVVRTSEGSPVVHIDVSGPAFMVALVLIAEDE